MVSSPFSYLIGIYRNFEQTVKRTCENAQFYATGRSHFNCKSPWDISHHGQFPIQLFNWYLQEF